ncbi:MAG: hypothetical protein JSS66_03345 [Armatimonadetes bacterium]|nr:hypothetical protein [Armatimonadota bacterium]
MNRTSLPCLPPLLGLALAAVACSATIVGCGKGDVVFTNAPKEQYDRAQTALKVRERLAAAKKVEPWEIKPSEVAADPELKSWGKDPQEIETEVSRAVAAPDNLEEPKALTGFSEVNWADAKGTVVNYATSYTPVDDMLKAGAAGAAPKPVVTTLGERLGKGEYKIFKVDLTATPPTAPGQPKAAPTTNTIYFGPIIRGDLDKIVAEAMKRGQGQKINVTGDSFPVKFYANQSGKVIAGVDDPKKEIKLDHIANAIQLTYFKYSTDVVKKAMAAAEKNPTAGMPPMQQIETVRASKG